MNFYLDNQSNEQYRYDEFFDNLHYWVDKENSQLLTLTEANNLNLQKFIYKNYYDLKPSLSHNYYYLTIPYELDEEILPNIYPSYLIANVLNFYMYGNIIYIASTNRDKCCVIKNNYLNDNIIWTANAGYHMNTPFLIFTEKADIFALIDYDLPLQIIGYKPHLKVEIPYYDEIQQGFNTVLDRYRSYTNMPNLFRTYYDFLLPKWFKY